ncbi:E3 SUMO-protein ligase ZBED1-like [Melanotaenia boesemani]|uniref:E3 SUMO-protein ligase ZBED1-like n=1 Tax=Melanotaenia boesemani TaxID=1250792 RepID=UPI001C0496B2|nr:E3 SUMO-protein ligase ZBED1-like [Melanotaenia boesemani]
MIAKDLQPISIVEDRGFNAFVKTLDPHYRIPSRKRMMEGTITDLYNSCKDNVKAALQHAQSVVLPTDMWTSRTTEAYLTVSCHFIDNWQMQEFVLETRCFPGQHAADIISLELKRITDEWAITQKVIAVVTDNGANMVSAVHKAGWKHYPCIAHTLNLVIKDGIKAVPEVVQLLTKCSSIVSFFHHSAKATEKLKQIQKQLKGAEHKLIQSVETRWNSVFYMLERLHKQREAVTTALCLLGKSSLCLNDEEFSMIHLTAKALRPYEEVTREVSPEEYVSVSKVIPLVSLLHRAAAATEHQGSSLSAELGLQIQCRFHGIETCYSLAASTFLDIRFKNLVFRDKDNVEKHVLLTEMQETYHLTSESSSAGPPAAASSPGPSSASLGSPAPTSSSAQVKKGIWADFDSQVLAAQQHRTTGTDALIEMRRYMEEKPVPRDQDPLLWWKSHEQAFSSLSRLAAKYLGITASSVPSERIFSKAGELVSQRRNRLTGDHVNILLFLNKNI